MYQETRIGVVVPAYNEAGFVGDVIDTVPAFVDRVYVIDDASTDDTWAEILAHAVAQNDEVAGESRRVVPIRHGENRGVGGAIKTGYRRALDDGMEVVTVLGGDGQMDPDLLYRVIEPIVRGRAEYAKGNRLLRAEDSEDMPRFRYVGNVVLTLLTRISSGYWTLGDPQNGYTAISNRALEAVDLDEMYEYYGYCNDLLVKLNVADMRVVDVAMPAEYGEEESHITYSRYIPRVSSMLLGNFLWRLRRKYGAGGVHPVLACYATSVVGTLASLTALVSGGSSGLSGAALTFSVAAVALVVGMGLDRRANAHLAGVDDATTDREPEAKRRRRAPSE